MLTGSSGRLEVPARGSSQVDAFSTILAASSRFKPSLNPRPRAKRWTNASRRSSKVRTSRWTSRIVTGERFFCRQGKEFGGGLHAVGPSESEFPTGHRYEMARRCHAVGRLG